MVQKINFLREYGNSSISFSIEHFDACLQLLTPGEPFEFHKFIELTSYFESYVLYDLFNILGHEHKKISSLSSNAITLLKGKVSTGVGRSLVFCEGNFEKLLFNLGGRKSIVNESLDFGSMLVEATADEEYAQIPYHIPIEILHSYLDIMEIEKSHQIYSLLFEAYMGLSDSLRSEINQLQQYLRPQIVFVPPIMAIVLQRASKREDLIEVLLEIKEEFSPVRQAFKEYELRITDPSLRLKDSLSAIKELRRSTEQLISNQNTGAFVMSEWRDGLSLLPDSESLENIDTGLTKFFLGKPLEWMIERIRQRKIIRLFNLKKEFLNINDYGCLIDKVFSYELKSSDIQSVSEYIASVDRLSKCRRIV